MKAKHFYHSLTLAILFATSCLFSPASVNAQADLTDEDRATILFDVRLSRMRDGEFMKGLEDLVDGLPNISDQIGIDLNSVERVFGAASLPESIEEFSEQEIPESVQFFLRVEMADAESAKDLLDTMGGEEVELNGKTYRSPQKGTYSHLLENSNTVEIATEKYLEQTTLHLFSKGLFLASKKTPGVGVHIVADLASESELVAQVIEAAKADSSPMVAPILDLIVNASDLSISIDLDGDNLLSIVATGNNESDAEELRGGLDKLLGIAKNSGAPLVNEFLDPNTAEMADNFLESLEAIRDGLKVRVDIPHPDGFDDAIRDALEMIPMLMGGGFGPGF